MDACLFTRHARYFALATVVEAALIVAVAPHVRIIHFFLRVFACADMGGVGSKLSARSNAG